MKLSESRLRNIIREELNEASYPADIPDPGMKMLREMGLNENHVMEVRRTSMSRASATLYLNEVVMVDVSLMQRLDKISESNRNDLPKFTFVPEENAVKLVYVPSN